MAHLNILLIGFWEKTDFSGCRLKKKEEPGDIALLSFNFAYFSGIEDTTKFLPQMVYDVSMQDSNNIAKLLSASLLFPLDSAHLFTW